MGIEAQMANPAVLVLLASLGTIALVAGFGAWLAHLAFREIRASRESQVTERERLLDRGQARTLGEYVQARQAATADPSAAPPSDEQPPWERDPSVVEARRLGHEVAVETRVVQGRAMAFVSVMNADGDVVHEATYEMAIGPGMLPLPFVPRGIPPSAPSVGEDTRQSTVMGP